MATAKKEKEEIHSTKMKTTVDIIQRKFDDDKVLERKGQGGKMFKYVKAQEYIVRLNEAFGLAWSSEICQHWMANNSIVMWVRIHYPHPDYPDNPQLKEFKDGIDAHPFSGDVGNAFKAAYLKAFKKAAAQIGVALQIWGIDIDEDDDVPVWEDHNQVPNVTVVNPGPHNPIPAPPQYADQHGLPLPPPPIPVGMGGPTPPAPANVGPPVPEFVNRDASALPAPPPHVGPPLPPPPVPMGNPNAATGVTRGPGTPASASVGLQSVPGGGIEAFQVNGIKGIAVTRGIDAMQLVTNILGDIGITAVEQLTSEQAQKVMDLARHMPPQ